MPRKAPGRRREASPSGPVVSPCPELDDVLDAFPCGLYAVDRELRVTAWNRHREAGPQGRPRAEVLGRPLSRVLSRRGFRALEPVLRRVLDTGEPHEELTEPAGQARLFRVRRLPLCQKGRITQVLSWFEDVTERRALEMQLIASDRLAFLGQLVAGVVHEVANPLASIAGCAEALASVALEAPSVRSRREAKEFRELIRSEVGRCERILRSLLQSVRRDPAPSADVTETVETVLRLLDRHPAFTRVRVVRRLARSLPRVGIDSDSLKQVVIALAVNAAQAMSSGGTLTFQSARDGKLVRLEVMDTGPGVPESIRPHVFEPFFTTNKCSGTGLGLAVARSLVRGRGGDLTLRPRRGRGAAFRVTLRRA